MAMTNIKDGMIVFGIGAGIIGIGAAVWWFSKKGEQFAKDIERLVKEPLSATTDIATDVTIFTNATANNIGKAVTGGVIDLNFKTFGTSGTAQDEYERAKLLHDHPGSQQALIGATIAIGSAPVIGQGFVAAAAAVNGISKKVKGGKDIKMSSVALKTPHPVRDALIEKQTIDRKKAIKSKNFDFKPDNIGDPLPLLTSLQLKTITDNVNAQIAHGHALKLSSKARTGMKNILKVFHALKQLQLEGLSLNHVDAKAVNMNAQVFFLALQKITHPHALIVVSKTKVRNVKAFLTSRDLLNKIV